MLLQLSMLTDTRALEESTVGTTVVRAGADEKGQVEGKTENKRNIIFLHQAWKASWQLRLQTLYTEHIFISHGVVRLPAQTLG